MPEYIEREALIDEIEGTTWYHISCQKNLVKGAACEADALYKATDIYNAIKSAPTADVVEVRHGEWGKIRYLEGCVNNYQHTCNACGKSYFDNNANFNYPYCPNCGAKMDGE